MHINTEYGKNIITASGINDQNILFKMFTQLRNFSLHFFS